MQTQLRSAPKGMRGGFFVSSLEFYELQRALYEGTIWAIGVSLILALIVLALVTLNPLISLYAIVTVGAVIIVTVAFLILLGWQLDVLESVAISTAIGRGRAAIYLRYCEASEFSERDRSVGLLSRSRCGFQLALRREL